MKPEVKMGKYFIASVDESQMMNLSMYLEYIVCIYREEEGLSVVFLEDIHDEIDAMSEHEIKGPFALIEAEGLLLAEKLEKEKISVKAFSAYFHDHLLVPSEHKEDALIASRKLQAKKE